MLVASFHKSINIKVHLQSLRSNLKSVDYHCLVGTFMFNLVSIINIIF